MFFSVYSQHSRLFRSTTGFVMPKPVFRRLTNGQLKLDYTEAARSLKLSRVDAKKDAAQNKSLTAEEVVIYKLSNF